MTFEERTNSIGTLLRETILPRYTRPPHLDDDTARAELRDMVDDLNTAWPVSSRERFEQTGQALARALRLTYTGRNWPTIAHLAKALKQAQEAPASALMQAPKATSTTEREEWKRDQVRAWLDGKSPVAPHLVTMERLGAIGCRNAAGAFAFAHDIRNAGISDDLTPKERDRYAEWHEGFRTGPHGEAPKGNVVTTVQKHWSETAAPDDPRHAALKAAREKAGRAEVAPEETY